MQVWVVIRAFSFFWRTMASVARMRSGMSLYKRTVLLRFYQSSREYCARRAWTNTSSVGIFALSILLNPPCFVYSLMPHLALNFCSQPLLKEDWEMFWCCGSRCQNHNAFCFGKSPVTGILNWILVWHFAFASSRSGYYSLRCFFGNGSSTWTVSRYVYFDLGISETDNYLIVLPNYFSNRDPSAFYVTYGFSWWNWWGAPFSVFVKAFLLSDMVYLYKTINLRLVTIYC